MRHPNPVVRTQNDRSQSQTVIYLPSQANLKRLKKQPILGVKRTKTKLTWGTREGKQEIRSDSVGYQSRWLKSPHGWQYVLRIVDRYLVQYIPYQKKTVYIAHFVDNKPIFLVEVPKNHYLYERIESFLGIDLAECQRSIAHTHRASMIRSCSVGQHQLHRARHKKSKSRHRLGKREREAKANALDLTPYANTVTLKKHELKRALESKNL